MKKTFIFSVLFLLSLLIGFFLSGCQATESSDAPGPDKGLQAVIDSTGDYQVDIDSCQGMRSYGISYQILDSTEFLGHSFALRILAGPPTNLDSCICDSLVYCVTLSFPIQQVSVAGFKNQNSPYQPTYLVKDGQEGWAGHTDPRGASSYQSHVICAAQDSNRLVFFDLIPGFPSGYDLRNAIIGVEGICIVGNVEDTNEEQGYLPGENEGSGGQGPSNG